MRSTTQWAPPGAPSHQYSINENFGLYAGLRYYDVDYESGSGATRFKWDVTHTGPVVGFSWEFGG